MSWCPKMSWIATFAVVLVSASAPVGARGRPALGPDQWRADLQQAAAEIRGVHPRPFSRVEEAEFDAAVARLDREIPGLSEHAVILRLARIVAMLQDGHTRLALPRTHPELALSYSHAADPAPTAPVLRFGQLAVRLVALEEGLFVAWAAPGREETIGRKVVSFGDVPASEALAAAGTLISADNAGARRLGAADRLALPEVLSFIGVESGACGIPVTLAPAGDGAPTEACWPPLPDDLHPETGDALPPYRVRIGEDGTPVVLELAEITSRAERPIGAAVARAVQAAESTGSPLVLDLRRNTGGDNAYGRLVTLALARSRELNSFGRLFVLVGPRTFSAAQNLLNELERYTRVLFVGEPSGSRPDHFGDARRIRLENSGLTLRVSSLHWSSGTAGDTRDATRPHVPAPRTARSVFRDGDAALEAVGDYEFAGLGELIAGQLRLGHVYNAANVALLDAVDEEPELTVDDYLAMAAELTRHDELLPAAYALQIALHVHPGDPGLEAAFREARERL